MKIIKTLSSLATLATLITLPTAAFAFDLTNLQTFTGPVTTFQASLTCPSTSAPSVTLVSPNGGETFTQGQSVSLHITSCNVPGGTAITFKLLDTSTNAEVATLATGVTTSTDTTLAGAMPHFPIGQGGNHYKVMVVAGLSLPLVSDMSDATFTISPVTINIITTPFTNTIPLNPTTLTNVGSTVVTNPHAVDPSTLTGTVVSNPFSPTNSNPHSGVTITNSGILNIPDITTLLNGLNNPVLVPQPPVVPNGNNGGGNGGGGGFIAGGGYTYNYTNTDGSTGSYTPTVTMAPLRPKTKSPDVAVLQWALKVNGTYTGNLDASYGPKTYKAVKAYQKMKGLKSDGFAGVRTLGNLGVQVQAQNTLPY